MGVVRPSLDLSSADLILDAMLGYGSSGDPRPPIAGWIRLANGSGRPILALDSPSGLDTTTGIPDTPCIQATATLTLALPKTGLLTTSARSFVGDLYLGDIGVPSELYTAMGLKVDSPFHSGTLVRVG